MAKYSTSAKKAFQSGVELAIPDEMSTPAWAETYRFVDRGNRKGKWSNDTQPLLTEIMACADDPAIREIVIQKPVQWGGSEVANNIFGKKIQLEPTDMAYVAEKEDKATAWTQESFDAMVRVTPELNRLVRKEPEFNNQKFKGFTGGGLYILWATSPAELSSRPLKVIVFDEKAAYKPTREGDPVKLGQARQTTYDGEQLTVFISTPRRCGCGPEETCGDITHDYERGDQREYYVPCPHCEEFQTLKFGGKDCPFGLKWDPESPEIAWYLCEHCHAVIEEFDREEMLRKGYWRAAKPFNGVASFKSNQLYSPFVSWGTIAVDFLDAKTSSHKLEVFTNTVLGDVWKPVEQIEYEPLTWLLENYLAQVPLGVLILTAAVDIQKDRIEVEIVGWGKDHESWSIEYRVFYGSPGIEMSEDDDDEVAEDDDEGLTSVWKDLEDFLVSSFVGVDGQIFRVQCAAIDSGYLSRLVYKFCRKHRRKRWFPVKGMSDPFKPLLSKATLQGHHPKVQMFPVGTNAAKDEVFASLKVTKPGPGYCHFPDQQPYNEEAHMKMFASEKMVTHSRGGRTYRVYEKVGANVRNEALDIRVYNVAARTIINPKYDLLAKRRLQHVEVADLPPDDNDPNGKPPAPPPKEPPEQQRSRLRLVPSRTDGYDPSRW
jgi:phage terminase large subunit GpA-like protein